MRVGDLSPSSRRGSACRNMARSSASTFLIFLAVAGWQMLPVSFGNEEAASAAAPQTLEHQKNIEPNAHGVAEAIGAAPTAVESTATAAAVTAEHDDAPGPSFPLLTDLPSISA